MDNESTGRDLDGLIAVNIMGWRWWRSTLRNSTEIRRAPMPPEFINPDNEWEIADSTEEPFGGPFVMVPEYSAQLEAAWLVIERLKIDFWEGSIEVQGPTYKARFHFCGSTILQRNAWSAVAATAPLAICRAALSVRTIPQSTESAYV